MTLKHISNLLPQAETNAKIVSVMEQLKELRQDLCDIENQRQPVGKSILAIDRIDTLTDELDYYIINNN